MHLPGTAVGFCFIFLRFIYSLEGQSYGEKHTDTLRSSISCFYSPRGSTSYKWGKLKLGARSFM